MNKEEILSKLDSCEKKLLSTNDSIFDDGCDNDDEEQNMSYCNNTDVIYNVHDELLGMKGDLDSKTKEKLWKKAWWGEVYNHHSPEGIFNHSMNYIHLVREYLK